MNNTEARFLQVVLLLLALLFTFTVRYLADTRAAQVSTGTAGDTGQPVTVAEAFYAMLPEGR